jgi:hypothetical protein
MLYEVIRHIEEASYVLYSTRWQLYRNSTKIKTIRTQVFDKFMAHNLSGLARKKDGEKFGSEFAVNSRQPLTRWGTEFTLTAALL